MGRKLIMFLATSLLAVGGIGVPAAHAAPALRVTYVAGSFSTYAAGVQYILTCEAYVTGGIAVSTSITTCKATMPWGQVISAPAVTIPGSVAVTQARAQVPRRPNPLSVAFTCSGKATLLNRTLYDSC